MLPTGVTFEVEVPKGRRFRLHPDREPIPHGEVTEKSRLFFHLSGSGFSIFEVELSVDGVRLERVALSPTHLRWQWLVGFHAGSAELELRGVGTAPLRLEVVTDPDARKLNREEFTQMVGDILTDTLSLVSLTGHRVGIAKGGRALEYARLEYLRKCFDRMEQSVRQIDRAPWLRLERESRTVPLSRAHGTTALELSKAARTAVPLLPHELERLSETGRRLAGALGNRLPRSVRKSLGRFDNRRREHSDILMVLQMWRGFLARAASRLEHAEVGEEDRARLDVQRKRVRQMGRRLERLMTLPVFEGVTPSHGRLEPSHLFLRVPAYRSFYKAYRGFLSGLADVTGAFLNLPLQRTFDLYELWCFLRFAHAAALEAGDSGSLAEAFVERAAQGGLVLHLEEKPLTFGSYTLVFQPVYREIWRREDLNVGSFSREMRPDIALLMRPGPEGEPRPVVVLDAKYRVEAGINDAISSIHMYRDALVERTGQTAGEEHRRAVEAAFILTPQVPAGAPSESWRAEKPPVVFFRQGYREAFRFGAVTMRPGVSIDQCRDLLLHLLESGSAAARK